MDLIDAAHIVIADVHASFPELSYPQAISYVRQTVVDAEVNDDDTETAPAYHMVLQASVASLVLAIATLEELTLDQGDVHEDTTTGHVTIDGRDPFEWLHDLLIG